MFQYRNVKDETASIRPAEFKSVEQAFLKLEAPLLRYAQRLLGDIAMAEDIVQDAFLKLQKDFPEVRSPRSWLFRTVHNLSLNYRRNHQRLTSTYSDPNSDHTIPFEAADPQPLPDEHIARWESIGLVRLGLDSLEERSRELLRLKFQDNLSYKEISHRTGLTVSHVGYLLHHAIKALAGELTKSGAIDDL